jgi:putative photosynthetic complex assembly protein 2
MSDRALAAGFVLAIWWLSTGIVLKLVWLGRSAFTIVASSVLALEGLAAIVLYCRSETPAAAYVSFCGALAVWAWHELMFLLGIVTGPRKVACPDGARGWRRFSYATEAIIHHEIALALTLFAVIGLTWGRSNQIGTSTFAVLWAMRLSAKLNVFLGVRNLAVQFVPERLRYLISYFRCARMNWLMPASIALATAVVIRIGVASASQGATAFERVGRTLVATLLGLAVLEHVFLALPLPDAVLWRWANLRLEA